LESNHLQILRGFFPDFLQQNKFCPKKARAPSKRDIEHWNAPLEEAIECQRSLIVCRGALPYKFDFLVAFSMAKRLVILVN
jgi:hypothetical protein